jgi:GT2 family glycosyltransferase
MSAEDLDLGWRMRMAGWATRYEPAAIVDHAESAATGQVWENDQLALHWQRCAYAWMLRRRGRTRTVIVGALNFLGSGGRYLIQLVRAGFQSNARIRAMGRWTLVHRYAFAPRRKLERFR